MVVVVAVSFIFSQNFKVCRLLLAKKTVMRIYSNNALSLLSAVVVAAAAVFAVKACSSRDAS